MQRSARRTTTTRRWRVLRGRREPGGARRPGLRLGGPRARRDRRFRGLVPPPTGRGGFSTTSSSTAGPSLRPKRARTEPLSKCAVPLLPPRPWTRSSPCAHLPRACRDPARGAATPVCPLCSVAISNCVSRRPAATSPRRRLDETLASYQPRHARRGGSASVLQHPPSRPQTTEPGRRLLDQDFTPLASNHALQSWASGTTALNARCPSRSPSSRRTRSSRSGPS